MAIECPLVGMQVKRISGYHFRGEIVSVFTKLNGSIRVVVEHHGGMLHIFNTDQLERVDIAKRG